MRRNGVSAGPSPAVLSDIDGSLVTAHASGQDRHGWEPVVRAYELFARAQPPIRLHLVTLNGAPFVAGICNGISHEAAEDMLGNVHVGEGNVSLIVRDGPGKEWCEIPIEDQGLSNQVDRVHLMHMLAKNFPELRLRSVGMSVMISYQVAPYRRAKLIEGMQEAVNKFRRLSTPWEVGEGGHEHIIDIVSPFAADKGRGIKALLAHAEGVGQPIDIARSAWFGDSAADIKALDELTSGDRRDTGTAIGFVATHAGATAQYIEAVKNSRVPYFVSHETVAERAVPEMLAEYDRVIKLGVYGKHVNGSSHFAAGAK